MIDAVLLLYHRPALLRDASTVMEHIGAFARHSRFRVFTVNTEEGFPERLAGLRFRVALLHYSLFGGTPYPLDARFVDWLAAARETYKLAFFQDEYQDCRARFAFIDALALDCVYTLVEPDHWDATYRAHTRAGKLVYTIPGLVSEDLVAAARRWAKPEADRTIDVGYRARPLPFFMGRGAQEKTAIAEEFLRRARGLRLDIAWGERDRLYGSRWHRFLGDCRGVLGVEAGVSIFDLDDRARAACDAYLAKRPGAGFEEVHDAVLRPFEDRVFYRTISPRHFEAAAFHVCQILFEGKYSGILQPMVHYLPLKKDFSNLDEVLRLFGDPAVRRELTANAHRDLIASGRHSYRAFVESFDRELAAAGIHPAPLEGEGRVRAALRDGAALRKLRATARGLRHIGGRLRDRLFR